MNPFFLALALLAGPALADTDAEFSGRLRPQAQESAAATAGPLKAAAQSRRLVEAELKARLGPVNAALYLQEGSGPSRAAVQELYASGEALGWQFSAGRKLVSWDVGYAFRPNDVVAQEERRTLLSSMARGRPLLQAEYFSAETAWTLVWVNPLAGTEPRHFGEEQALALRVYQRQGAADWHGFARWGERTGASLGAALSWVASDSLELHGSLRLAQRNDAWRMSSVVGGPLQASSPWAVQQVAGRGQALLGFNWTGENRLGLLAEAWWDGNALSRAQWSDWTLRNQALAALANQAPAPALAGNLAWQASAFGNSSLRRQNVFLRASWEQESWQPTLDLLYTPEDGGRILTAALGWAGDRWRFDAGLRHYGGRPDSVIAQLPQKRLAYAAATWSF